MKSTGFFRWRSAGFCAFSFAAGGLLPVTVSAQQTDTADNDGPVEEIIVRGIGSRLPADLSSVPGSVTIIGVEELGEQSLFSNDLGEILQRSVPGFGVSSSGSFSNFSQTLRGRKPAVFIDGVPTTVPLRDGGRDLRVISPGAVGNVEVIRGSTALYGLGGAGGLINYATREPGDGAPEYRTDVSLGTALTHGGDSANYTLQQSAQGRSDRLSWVLSGFYESYRSLFDAKGQRIPPDPQGQGGIADTDAFNVFAKFGFDLSRSQSLFLSANAYEIEQDTPYSNGAGAFGSRPAPAVNQKTLGEGQSTENMLVSLRYVNDEFLGGALNAQIFYSDYEAVFGFFLPPVFPPDGGQSLIDAERTGLRFDVSTPIDTANIGGNLLWGVDFVTDTTSQPMTDGRLLVPEMEQDSLAPFLQAELALSETFTLVGGLRHEDAEIATGTFTTIAIFVPSLPGGVTIQGGKVDYSETLFNVGFVWSPFAGRATQGMDVYGGFSQGFTVNDFGRALRSTTVGTISEFDFAAQVIDSYELGLRKAGDIFDLNLAVFFNTSEFGSSFNAVTLELVRAPEKIWGAELTVNAQASDAFALWGSISWVNGDVESAPGTVKRLDTSRIPPVKLTAGVRYAPNDDWRVLTQITHSAAQRRFENQRVFGRADVEAYTLLDVSLSRRFGRGQLTLALGNLLNEYYFTPDAYRFAGDNTFTSGAGTTARLTYSIGY